MTDKGQLAKRVVEKMMEDDLFSQWMKIKVIEIREGYSIIKLELREEMINGLNVIHGGIIFSLADSAFAFACNNRNNLSMALDVSVSFTKAVNIDDILTAEAMEVHNGRTTGVYMIEIHNQDGKLVALFKGTCFRTGKALIKQ